MHAPTWPEGRMNLSPRVFLAVVPRTVRFPLRIMALATSFPPTSLHAATRPETRSPHFLPRCQRGAPRAPRPLHARSCCAPRPTSSPRSPPSTGTRPGQARKLRTRLPCMRRPPAETPPLSGAGSHQPMQRPSAPPAPLSISPCHVLHPPLRQRHTREHHPMIISDQAASDHAVAADAVALARARGVGVPLGRRRARHRRRR